MGADHTRKASQMAKNIDFSNTYVTDQMAIKAIVLRKIPTVYMYADISVKQFHASRFIEETQNVVVTSSERFL